MHKYSDDATGTAAADFESWKDHEEKTELVHFVLSGGTKHLASGRTKKYLACHRSGLYVKTGRECLQHDCLARTSLSGTCFW
ncbi:hypothetical protein V5799_014339 [Amblyomma americanum]|uniref:Uncharacterized protein n=1 Tax=Amblyomma americanum TaxID=6943 RepID=A0AAQ4E3C4_AMBAM